MVDLKPGSRWCSTVCDTEIVVVKGVLTDIDLECGGSPMVSFDSTNRDKGVISSGFDGGTEIGKRYIDADATIEILCTRPGLGSLAVAGRPMQVKSAKMLPSSD